MSKPAWIWGDKLDFPILNSMDDEAKDFSYSMFNFDKSLEIRDSMDVSAPDFEKMKLSSYCDNVNETVKKYCDLAENLPDIDHIMPLMYLASFPMDIPSSSLKTKIK